MDFIEILSRHNKDWVLSTPNPSFPTFINEEPVLDCLVRCIKEGKRILAYGDYDFDGLSCREIIKLVLTHLGHKNFELYPYFMRTHQVDPIAINRAITGKFDCMIICDAGSSDPLTLQRLRSQGVEVILLDHHKSVFSYSDFEGIHMINTSFDNRVTEEEVIVSAGALTYIVFSKLCERLGVPELKSTSALALASLYSDSIDMTGDIQRSIYQKATSLSTSELPVLLQRFIYSINLEERKFGTRPYQFNRRYLEFTVAPRINSLFRAERFDLLNKLIDWKPTSSESIGDLVMDTVEFHSMVRHELAKASDILVVKELRNLVIGNLSSVANDLNLDADSISNYTGLVANDLCSKFGKMAVVVADSGVDIKGSVRDHLGRDYLSLFRTFSNANGHNAAFGFRLGYLEFQQFLRYLEELDSHAVLASADNKPIIIPHNLPMPDPELLQQMAWYNEFSGNTCPKGCIEKMWFASQEPRFTKFGMLYPWGDFKISVKRKNGRLRPGSKLILQPIRGYADKNNHGVSLDLVKAGV